MPEYILENISFNTLSVYDLLKHTAGSSFIENKDFDTVYPLAIENNLGIFTKSSLHPFPTVTISKIGNSLLCSCTCDHTEKKLCLHQAEIIHCILEQKKLSYFF
ncbi:hypothetical protein [Chryseobacterium sp. P1-3]|uniref:hypothetical protein n=1 Tax=Chryseobacterium sp. (strain P1-3) TaxID=1517683 RepID=UPI000AC30E76|nr:hypothetical protein [Chryseobacterium sp. P1-3]